ncbi:hypothetical protein DESC_660105 [Desulfosarcina cetonica]|nr:hypothetical protein DESC_660105 [Desulfosarcina cetonica]
MGLGPCPGLIHDAVALAQILGEMEFLHDLGRGVNAGIFQVFRRNIGFGRLIGGGVLVIVGKLGANFRIENPVDPLMRRRRMGRLGGNAHGIIPDLAALFGDDETEVLGILGDRLDGIPIVNDGRHRRSGDHIVLAAHAGLEAHAILGLLGGHQEISRGLEFHGLGAVEILARIHQGDAHHLAHRIDQPERSGLLGRVEQDRPAFDRIVSDLVLAVHQAHRAPLVGHGVLVARIIGGVSENRFEVLQVGDLAVIEGLNQMLVDQDRHDIVGRHDDVVLADPAGLQLGDHLLVVLIDVQTHFDAGLGLEVGRHLLFIHVFRPGVDSKLLGTGRNPGQQNQYRHQQSDFTHRLFSFFRRFLACG